MGKSSVFISYSHRDERWKQRLIEHLKVLELEDVLTVWDDRQITAGDSWEPEIEAAMEGARVALLLISADFLTSRFIRGKEVPRLLERRQAEGLRVIPVLVRPCPWQAVEWLSEMQFRPRGALSLAEGTAVQVEKNLAALALEIGDLVASDSAKAEAFEELASWALRIGLLSFLAGWPEGRQPPSLTEICRGLEIRSRKSTYKALEYLLAEGWVEKRKVAKNAFWQSSEQGREILERLATVATIKIEAAID